MRLLSLTSVLCLELVYMSTIPLQGVLLRHGNNFTRRKSLKLESMMFSQERLHKHNPSSGIEHVNFRIVESEKLIVVEAHLT
ncbi:hypothetical protein B7P43_G09021 [Cryptotermes secundus]|uniref:Secreted protein n=1 Tax=Cryptotermes secundus TaxID=105785 RepID=A0A2J7PQB4_9NEOP|nr:hypothetical protein B7P43_G09021 [Cryptotermes secundus]